jgi:D-alanyl-D-alanine carboxypeptidase
MIPGAILHVRRDGHGSWAGAAGLGRLDPDVAIHAGDRFRAGSIVKPFDAARVLQLVEGGRFTLDSTLPDVLPASVVDRFPTAPEITVRMLLGHRSGLADWSTPVTDAAAARASSDRSGSRRRASGSPKTGRCWGPLPMATTY